MLLRWGRPRGRRPARYLVYVARKRKVSTRRTSARVRGLRCGKRYRFGVIAVSSSGRRSRRAATVRSTTRCSRSRSLNAPLARAAADTAAPVIVLWSPQVSSDRSALLSGLAGVDTGDSLLVTVRLYAGSTASGAPVQSITSARTFGMYTVQSLSLSPGTYTARAEQRRQRAATPATARRSRSPWRAVVATRRHRWCR